MIDFAALGDNSLVKTLGKYAENRGMMHLIDSQTTQGCFWYALGDG